MAFRSSSIAIKCLMLIWTVNASCNTHKLLTEKQAIRLAERFIQDNGYTNAHPDKAKTRYELLDGMGGEPIDSILLSRHGQLHPKAFCISSDDSEWHVGFLSSEIELNKLIPAQRDSNLKGRAVIVMKYAKEVRIAHKMPLFSRFRKL